MKPRGVFLFRAIICFICGITTISMVLIKLSQPHMKDTISFGIGMGLLVILVGFINLLIYINDKNNEMKKDNTIRDLENEIKELKNKTNSEDIN